MLNSRIPRGVSSKYSNIYRCYRYTPAIPPSKLLEVHERFRFSGINSHAPGLKQRSLVGKQAMDTFSARCCCRHRHPRKECGKSPFLFDAYIVIVTNIEFDQMSSFLAQYLPTLWPRGSTHPQNVGISIKPPESQTANRNETR